MKPTTSIVYRSIDNARAMVVDVEARTVEMSFASDFPVERYDWIEVLDVRGMDLSRIGSGAAAFLVEHDRRDQVGVIESVTIGSDNIARAKVRFSKSTRGQEIFQDIVDGIRTLVSFGYQINEVQKTGEKDGTPIYTVLRFSPYEISTVSIPADPSVGVGRAADMDAVAPVAEDLPGTQGSDVETTATDDAERELEQKPEEVTRSQAPLIQTTSSNEAPKMDLTQIERARVADILALGQRFKADDAAREFIAGGKTVDEFRAHLLESKQAEPVRTATAGISDTEAASFSFLRMLNAQATGDWSKAGFERAASQAAGRSARGGMIVPVEVLLSRASQHTVGVPADGGNLVATELRAENFIEKLQSRMMVRAMGATVLDGLQGNVAFPKETGLMGVAWVGEDGTATNTKAAFGQVPMTPRTVLAKTSISRRLMLQASLSVENFVRDRLQKAVALAGDKAALIGGGANEPVGLLGGALAAGRKIVVGADYSFDEVVAMETLVAVADADIGALGYLTNASVRGAMKTTEKAVGTAQFLWTNGANGMGELNGYRAGVTSQLSGVQNIFGNWSDLMIGLWSGTDIVVDNTSADDGSHIVKVYQDMDVAVARQESFAFGAAA